jgi:hypothetical protein
LISSDGTERPDFAERISILPLEPVFKLDFQAASRRDIRAIMLMWIIVSLVAGLRS